MGSLQSAFGSPSPPRTYDNQLAVFYDGPTYGSLTGNGVILSNKDRNSPSTDRIVLEERLLKLLAESVAKPDSSVLILHTSPIPDHLLNTKSPDQSKPINDPYQNTNDTNSTNHTTSNNSNEQKSETDTNIDPNAILVVNAKDTQPFSVVLLCPRKSALLYKPFFFNRRSEYGVGHSYYESLTHGFPTRDVVYGCSARGFSRVAHPPAPLALSAFSCIFRTVNEGFLNLLRSTLRKARTRPPLSDSAIDAFIRGAFRNLAIQVHYGSESYPIQKLLHQDHIFSALHMGLTLSGHRNVAFIVDEKDLINPSLKVPMNPGDVYITTPASILHGAEMGALGNDSKSIAVQFRVFFEDSTSARECEACTVEISDVVCDVLRASPLRIPTYEEWLEVFETLRREAEGGGTGGAGGGEGTNKTDQPSHNAEQSTHNAKQSTHNAEQSTHNAEQSTQTTTIPPDTEKGDTNDEKVEKTDLQEQQQQEQQKQEQQQQEQQHLEVFTFFNI